MSITIGVIGGVGPEDYSEPPVVVEPEEIVYDDLPEIRRGCVDVLWVLLPGHN